MVYTINKTDGTKLLDLRDEAVDTAFTDLTLIGKNYIGFGEYVNENFVKLLENFAGTTQPSNALVGQLWFDKTEARMKVKTSTGWKAAGGPIIGEYQPLNLVAGDLWIDNNENQLHFYDGTDLLLAGPIWKKSQGKTGFIAETLADINKNSKPVLKLYVNDSLIGIFAAESFTPNTEIPGFTTLVKGYNSNSLISSIFSTTVTNSLKLNNIESSQFMRSDQSTTNKVKILIQNDNGLTIGANQTADFKIFSNTLFIDNNVPGGDIVLRTNSNTGISSSIYIDSGTNRVGFYTTSPQKTVDIAGDLRVQGNLIVEGDTASVNVSTLQIEDKNIELNKTETPTDLLADTAGLIIKGTIDKTILYNNSTTSFDISENLNLASGKSIRIGGIEILNGTTLTSAITSAPGLTSMGPQTSLTIDNLFFDDNKIKGTLSNQDIEIEPSGTGNIALIGSPRITGLAEPIEATDAATKIYAENFAKTLPLSVSFIDNGLTTTINSNISLFLTDIADPSYFTNEKIAFVHVQHIEHDSTTTTVSRSLKKFKINNNAWEFVSDLSSSI